MPPTKPPPVPTEASLRGLETRMRRLAPIALVVALVGLVAWWMVVFLDRRFLPLAILAAVAAFAILIRVARLDRAASKQRRRSHDR